VASLPLIAGVLGSLFELDNTGEKAADPSKKAAEEDEAEPRRRVQAAPSNGKASKTKGKPPGAELEDAGADDGRRARR